MRFEASEQLWPWSGYLALYIRWVGWGGALSPARRFGCLLLPFAAPFVAHLEQHKPCFEP